MSDKHEEWVARAREVAAALAVDAVERDRANAEPSAEVKLLKSAGLPALLIPEDLGGAGQTWRTALAVVREIAAADGSIAQLIGYHYVNAANLWLAGGEPVQRRLGRLTAENQYLWGDAVSPVEPDLALTVTGAGYLLNGKKTFATGASSGDWIAVTGRVESTGVGSAGEHLLAAVPVTADGITFGRDWDNLGQRLSASGSVTFTNTPVPTEDVIGPLGPAVTPLASAITPAIQAVFGHLYLGIAEGALRTARTYTLSTSRPWVLGGHDTVIDEPYVLAQYGDFDARLAAVGALADRAAAGLAAAIGQGRALSWAERGEIEIEVARLKVVATDAALDVTSKMFELTGARSTASKHGLDRFWRNVRTHTLHDPVAYKRREVGLHYLTGETPQFTLYT
jgi:alkylation response protein AidB-like acyl-CoA dehydrogenase